MNQKLLITGFCLILGGGLFLTHRVRETSAVVPVENIARTTKRNHPESKSFADSLVSKSSSGVVRARLLEKLAAIVKSGDSSDPASFSSVLVQLAEMDPAAAAEFAISLDQGPWRQESLRCVSRIWASRDAVGAERWAASLTDAAERLESLTDVCSQLAQNHAESAVQLAEKYSLGAESRTFMETLVQQWANQNYTAAMAWVMAKPANVGRDQMIMRLAVVRAETLPADAARLVVEKIPDSPAQTEAVISVIHQWAIRDMAGASEWVGLFPEGPLRERAETELDSIAIHQSQ